MTSLDELRAETIAGLGDGLHAFVKRDCAACTLVAPVLANLMERGTIQSVATQDDVSFPEEVLAVGVVDDDTSLRRS